MNWFVIALAALCCISVGFLLGYLWFIRNLLQETPPDVRHGLISTPSLSYWFRLRSEETNPHLRSLPLRQYREIKSAWMENGHD